MKNKIKLISFPIVAFLIGAFVGDYITSVRHAYSRALGAGNESLLSLELLKENRIEKIKEIKEGNLVASFVAIEHLPTWAKVFNPTSKDRPIPQERMNLYRESLDSASDHFLAKAYDLSKEDLKRILEVHFGHYEVIRASQSFVDEINQQINQSEQGD